MKSRIIIADSLISDLPISELNNTINRDSHPISLHTSQLVRQTSEEIRRNWSSSRDLFQIDEYSDAVTSISLDGKWLSHTKQQKYLRYIEESFKINPTLRSKMYNVCEFESILDKLILKAFSESNLNPRNVIDAFTEKNIFQTMKNLFVSINDRQPYLSYALNLLCENAESDTIISKLAEACDRADRCMSAQRQAFNILICAAYNTGHNTTDSIKYLSDLSTKEGALIRLYECVEDYLDDHKERAFISSFIAPARFYYHLTNNSFGKDHVNIHGLNWYLALLHATLGIQLPYLPTINDCDLMGVIDFWKGLTDDAWNIFCDPNNFGSDFEGIKEFKSSTSVQKYLKTNLVQDGEFPIGYRTNSAKELGNDAISLDSNMQDIHMKLSLYLNRFSFFFRREFLIKKIFESLNSELKHEHIGFRKAFETLYNIYRIECLTEDSPDSYLEYCYVDEYYEVLDINKTE